MTQYASVKTQALQLSAEDVETGANLQLPTTACLDVEEQELPPQFALEQLMFWFHQPQRKSDILCLHGAGELPCPTHVLRSCIGVSISSDDIARHEEMLRGMYTPHPSRRLRMHQFASSVDEALLASTALDAAIQTCTQRPLGLLTGQTTQPPKSSAEPLSHLQVQASAVNHCSTSGLQSPAHSPSCFQNACSEGGISDACATSDWFEAEIVGEKQEKVVKNKRQVEVTLYRVRWGKQNGQPRSADTWEPKCSISPALFSKWTNEARSAGGEVSDDVSSPGSSSAPGSDYATVRKCLLKQRLLLGSCLELPMVGSARGHIYGDVIYSDDSDVATAALHSGTLKANESGNVTVYITGPRRSFSKMLRNGIQSHKFSYWPGSFTFDRATMQEIVDSKNAAASSGISSGAGRRKKVCVRNTPEEHAALISDDVNSDDIIMIAPFPP